MINWNYKQLSKIFLESFNTGSGMVAVKNVNGLIQYAAPTFTFPNSRVTTVSLSATGTGVSFGTGGTEATEYDVNLENTITSGLNTSITYLKNDMDPDTGNPYIEWSIAITNTGTDTVTIREIGYKQNISVAPYVGSTTRADQTCLIDRTVLDPALELQPEDAGIIQYRLTTLLPEKGTVQGVKIVPWETGSDEDITAMIQAAHEGTIDLQTDAKWRIGMKRPIKISAFTGGGNVSHAEQTIDLVITSFEDYNNCGCVMQVDFDEALAKGQRMNATNTNVDGYGGSEMRLTTIPALVEALPEYIQDMLITFSVKTSAGNKSSTIAETTGNKLALRSVLELKGTNTYSYAGEGDGRIPFYALYADNKRRGRAGSTSDFWTRSPYSGNSYGYCYLSGGGGVSDITATSAYGLAPFGCI